MKISAAELQAGAMNDENLKIAVRTLKECGFVVLEDVLAREWVDRTRQVCDETLRRYMRNLSPEKRRTMEHTHTAMFPPACSPFMDAVAIENPFAVQVTEAAIGPDFFCTFYNTNTQWPHSGMQHVHRDFEHLFPGFPVPLPIIQVQLAQPRPFRASGRSHRIRHHHGFRLAKLTNWKGWFCDFVRPAT
jgi:hypothetical protein